MFSNLSGKVEVDPNGGFLCLTSHWQPNPKAPDPEMPGLKQVMLRYIPAKPKDSCLCGSGKLYKDCCQARRYWQPICPNPAMAGYSLVVSQAATFRSVDGAVLRSQLMEDDRLYCTDDSIKSSFWTLWGDPVYDDRQYGTYCFGDLELKNNRTFVVTAMSNLRMRILLELLQEVAGDTLGKPRMTYDSIDVLDKVTGKQIKFNPLQHGL
ncbi:MAG: hypothetical protein HC866_13785 [Leptolyngbyaceae cyanobacterium RU_5_1]|nr:hypothetical protein [Leptolyngbyaceae cyanobacterium RU_5_1]